MSTQKKKAGLENVIAKQNVKWLQLWDINGVEANKLLINVTTYVEKFPADYAGFLADSGKLFCSSTKIC